MKEYISRSQGVEIAVMSLAPFGKLQKSFHQGLKVLDLLILHHIRST